MGENFDATKGVKRLAIMWQADKNFERELIEGNSYLRDPDQAQEWIERTRERLASCSEEYMSHMIARYQSSLVYKTDLVEQEFTRGDSPEPPPTQRGGKPGRGRG